MEKWLIESRSTRLKNVPTLLATRIAFLKYNSFILMRHLDGIKLYGGGATLFFDSWQRKSRQERKKISKAALWLMDRRTGGWINQVAVMLPRRKLCKFLN